MTDMPTLTGQDIGQAQKAAAAVFDVLLAETGTRFLQWIALNAVATRGPALEQASLVEQATYALKIGEQPVLEAVDQLVAAGLLTRTGSDRPRLELTEAGDALFGRIRRGIDRIAERLYGGLPAEDLATAHRLLAIVTERANAELDR